MSKYFKLTVRQTVESINFSEAVADLPVNNRMSAFGTIAEDSILRIVKFEDDMDGELIRNLYYARTGFEDSIAGEGDLK